MSDILCICKVCGKRTKALSALSKHITHVHNLTQQEYYDLYYKEYNEGICPCCGSETEFNRFSYRRFCSIRCNGLFTLQQTQDNIDARIKGISTSKKFKRVHSSKKFKKKLSKALTNYYKKQENRDKLSKACVGSRVWTKEQKEAKSIQMAEIVSSFKNMTLYCYEEQLFHSSWELAYYIYCKDHNINISRKTLNLPYYFNGIKYTYIPDFIVENDIVEIKNPCLMSKLLQENTKDNAKYKCMMDNKVKIITDCSKYITYINTIYGENYLKSFKKDKGE